jgi:hypothetical protein
MTDQTNWRPMSPKEADVIHSILSQADIRHSGPLIADLDGRTVSAVMLQFNAARIHEWP